MRETLKDLEGRRFGVRATFVRFGSKTAFRGPPVVTLLLRDVTDQAGRALTDHVWFTMCQTWAVLDLQPGDQVAFESRVATYLKGYRNRHEDHRTLDYRLSHPTRARKISVAQQRGELFEMPSADEMLDGLRPRPPAIHPRRVAGAQPATFEEVLQLALGFQD